MSFTKLFPQCFHKIPIKNSCVRSNKRKEEEKNQEGGVSVQMMTTDYIGRGGGSQEALKIIT